MNKKTEWVRNWFSNMEPMDTPIVYQGISYHATENFYQAMKLPSDRKDLRAEISAMPARKSKTAIRDRTKYVWRDSWDQTKALKVMETALRHKFAMGTSWAEKLLATGETEIIEWNNWNDVFWGRCTKTNKGENHLGKILMKLRAELQDKTALPVVREPETYKTPEERVKQFMGEEPINTEKINDR